MTSEPAADAEPDSAGEPTVEDDASGIRRLMERGKDRMTAEQARAAALLEKYSDRPLLDVGLRIYQRDRESAGTVVGSALAFRLFLFFVPLLLFVVGLLGFVAASTPRTSSDGRRRRGSLAGQINTALTQPNSTRWIPLFVGLVGMPRPGARSARGWCRRAASPGACRCGPRRRSG